MDDISSYNRQAWDGLVARKNQWTLPVTAEQIEQARAGNWQVVLTPTRPVPKNWFGDLQGANVLCLAGGGGQQGPILAAAGADVTVFDNSNAQLSQDRLVSQREDLALRTVQGDMRCLKDFSNDTFDLVFHPCSNSFVPDIIPVWHEAYRVLKPGGHLLAGFINPVYFLFDYWAMERGELNVCHKIPYSDVENLDEAQRQKLVDDGEPFEFGHTLQDQIGGQLQAGFAIVDFFEDSWPEGATQILSQYTDAFIATRARKS